MTSTLGNILSLTMIPVAATIMGGTIAAYRVPGEHLRSFLQHFAAGVVLAAVAGELLPAITKGHQPLGVVIGFTIGVLTMLGVKQLAGHLESRAERQAEATQGGNTSLLAVVGIDVLIDGLLIGVGFAAGERVGLLLVIALTLELLFLGISLAASLGNAQTPRRQTILSIVGLSLLVVLGALIGGTLLSGLSGMALEIVLSFGAAALMYLVVEELLTEAHEVRETPLTTGAFFAGFVALYLLELMS
ncbi:ZIP family metal transporter [Deinococcus fonticola]|uniref:ZIP family metal transporter n=1 Tax=Deinococcus fonticola TaxID=2528713 RepID=UPI0010754983|nr:ZIP family metal transporter [Deinococcus fonticola]